MTRCKMHEGPSAAPPPPPRPRLPGFGSAGPPRYVVFNRTSLYPGGGVGGARRPSVSHIALILIRTDSHGEAGLRGGASGAAVPRMEWPHKAVGWSIPKNINAIIFLNSRGIILHFTSFKSSPPFIFVGEKCRHLHQISR